MKAKQNRFSRTVLAVAMLSVFGAAYADDQAVQEQTQPSSSVTVGVGGVTGDAHDRSLFTQYNGLRKEDAYLLLDFSYIKRDEATGTWTIVEGRDLGREDRELRALFGPQGNWKIYGEYWENVRRDPRTYNTALDGAGSTNPIVTLLPTRGAGNDVELKLERKRGMVGGEKWITPHLMFEATFTQEDKDGARLFGRGFACSSGAAPAPLCPTGVSQWAILFLPEPVSSTTRQIEAKMNFIGERLNLAVGYYGSFYNNDYGTLTPTVNGNLLNPLGNPMGVGGGVALTSGLRGLLQLPMALPPDNQAHQFSVAGNYRFAATTVGTFKYAYTHATQNEDFGSMGLTGAPGGRSNLGGVLNTNLAQAGIVTRPISKLQLNANFKYEDRDDKTPIDYYNIEGTSDPFTNGHISNKKLNGKVEGSYNLPAGFRGTVGYDYESIDRGQFVSTNEVAGLHGLRQTTFERGWRLELRKSMSDTLTGFVSWVNTERDGSTWLKLLGSPPGVLPADPDCQSATVGGVPNACIYSRTNMFPYTMTDRKRDKVRFLADWQPVERLSVQFGIDYGNDRYDAPNENKGLNKTDLRLYSVDASYAINDAWRLKAYYSYSEQTVKVAHSNGYIADLKDKNKASGIGIVGQATPRLRLAADVMYLNDTNQYNQTLDALASASNVAFFAQSGGLPDVTYKDFRIKLDARYALQKNQELGLIVIYDNAKLNEWTWGYNGVPFFFSDNTTVTLKPDQTVTFAGITYTYRFR